MRQVFQALEELSISFTPTKVQDLGPATAIVSDDGEYEYRPLPHAAQ